jgi:hypothetical protein
MPTQIGSRSVIKESTQEMQNQGFDEKYGVPAVVLTGEDASTTPNTLKRIQVDNQGNLINVDPRQTITMEYDTNNNPIYIGKAAMGTDKDEALWRIQKLTYSGTNLTDVQWADGDDSFNNVWDDRASYSYS